MTLGSYMAFHEHVRSHLLRAIFLVAFYGFLRTENISPHSFKTFDTSKHFLTQNLIFAPSGAHLIINWTKTLQDSTTSHVVQLPSINNYCLCPVRALRVLLQSRNLPHFPLFTNSYPPHAQIIDTHIRDALNPSWLVLIFPQWDMAITLSVGLGPPWLLTTMYMDSGVALPWTSASRAVIRL